jgi:CBS domain-containing protein
LLAIQIVKLCRWPDRRASKEDGMKAKDVMTKSPVCCTPDMKVSEVAEMLFEHDCGSIPVIANAVSREPVGIVTDRDITCRCVASGLPPAETAVDECMSAPAVTVSEDAGIDDLIVAMETHKVRRVLVVDRVGSVCGIVSQADVARHVSERTAGAVLKSLSEPKLLMPASR